MAMIVFTKIDEPGYGFRKTMVLSFVGIYTFGKFHETFNLSAYHEEQSQAIGGMVAAAVVYVVTRLVNESKFGVAMRKVLYWAFVGDLRTDVRKAN